MLRYYDSSKLEKKFYEADYLSAQIVGFFVWRMLLNQEV